LANNAKSEALELHELSSEQLDAVSGGFWQNYLTGFAPLLAQADRGVGQCYAGNFSQNDPAQMFQQIMQQVTGG
jgi:hypothetical protein